MSYETLQNIRIGAAGELGRRADSISLSVHITVNQGWVSCAQLNVEQFFFSPGLGVTWKRKDVYKKV